MLLLSSPPPRGRPDPSPPDRGGRPRRPAGTITLETGFDQIAAEPNFLTGAPRSVYAGPLLRLVYSPADNVEVDLEWVAFVGSVDDPDFGDASDRGDVTLRAKVRFVDGGARRPALGARFGVTLPETRVRGRAGAQHAPHATEMLLSQPRAGSRLHGTRASRSHDEVAPTPRAERLLRLRRRARNPGLPTRQVVGEIAGRAGKGSPATERTRRGGSACASVAGSRGWGRGRAPRRWRPTEPGASRSACRGRSGPEEPATARRRPDHLEAHLGRCRGRSGRCALAAPRETSMTRPLWPGKRSLMRTTTLLPVESSVTRTFVPKAQVGWAAVRSSWSKRSPLDVRLPS